MGMSLSGVTALRLSAVVPNIFTLAAHVYS